MKSLVNSHPALKTLALAALLTLTAGAAQAEGRPCLFDPPARQSVAPGGVQDARIDVLRNELAKIEAALRSGQISPYEAGHLMRRQWELAQFQRGFLEGATPAGRGGSCGGDVGINLAPLGDLAGDMAKTGMQTATKVMRALMRETERLIQERAAAEDSAM